MTDGVDWGAMSSGEFVKFEKVGDSVAGLILAVRPGTDFNGGPCPVLDLQTSEGERTLSCGQANLKAQIVALKPSAGDSIKVTFSSQEKVEKGVKKVFTIDHRPSGAETPTEAPAQPTSFLATEVPDDEPPF